MANYTTDKILDEDHVPFDQAKKIRELERALKIESALEKVRMRTNTMQRSDELTDVASVMFTQIIDLDIPIFACAFVRFEPDKMTGETWLSPKGQVLSEAIVLPFDSDPTFQAIFSAWKEGKTSLIADIRGKRLEEHLHFISQHMPVFDFLETTGAQEEGRLVLNCVFYSKGFLGFNAIQPLGEHMDILLRFGQVFDQTYTRFIDLQKAERQTREAQVEAALERVRARAMGMQKSEELAEVISVLFKQFDRLGINPAFAHLTLMDPERDTFSLRLTDTSGDRVQAEQMIDLDAIPAWRDSFNHWKESEENSVDIIRYKPESLDAVFDLMEGLISSMPVSSQMKASDYPNGIWTVQGHCKFGYLGMNITRPPTDDDKAIVTRFAAEFGRLYQRFLEIEKAEAQAREAQIEAAMERIRSRALAMRSSEEITDVVIELRRQIDSLGQLDLEASVVHLYPEEKDTFESIAAVRPPGESGDIVVANVFFPVDATDQIKYMIDMYSSEKTEYTIEFTKAMAEEWQKVLIEHAPMIASKRVGFVENRRSREQSEFWNFADFSGGSLLLVTHSPASDDTLEVLRKAAVVFDLAYRRHKDLLQAEATAREAQIETGLERVRSQTMAMQSSDDLTETASVLFKELISLGIEPNRLSLGIIQDPSQKIELWLTDEAGKGVQNRFEVSIGDNHQLQKMVDGWKSKEPALNILMEGEVLKDWITFWKDEVGLKFSSGLSMKQRYHYLSYFSGGFISLTSPEPQDQESTEFLRRFADGFNLTFTRFKDLQLAESRARKAEIEAAMERIRARANAMHKTDELREVVGVVYEQIIQLGFNARNFAIHILDKEENTMESWQSTGAMTVLPSSIKMTMFDHPQANVFKQELEARVKYSVIEMIGEEKKQLDKMLFEQTAFKDMPEDVIAYMQSVDKLIIHRSYMRFGAVEVVDIAPLEAEKADILKRVGRVFEQTYTRFLDLQVAEAQSIKLREEKIRLEKTLCDLKATQTQLIHAEKMASLGQLTAGIAHEIKNPLNFVNNFAEVSSELLGEMKEALMPVSGDPHIEEAVELADNVILNLDKIIHHGQRADGIVKGMLQHSRTSDGGLEPTNINRLADEYLRLAYHGLRAKNPTFNATMHTDYDDSIQKIQMVPQDIGRVLLNLITNAFYAVDEKSKKATDGYEPTVSVATRDNGKDIELSVADNGTGIPKAVMDQVFQPFFTTKPAGEGTGLGLSLSYDIIKAHNGSLDVASEEGQGAMFIIKLPKT